MILKKISIIFVIAAVSQIFGCSRGLHNRGMGNWDHMMGFGGGLMWVIIIALVGLLVYFAAKGSTSMRAGDSNLETPLDILKKRYAKGDIDQEEFNRKKNELE